MNISRIKGGDIVRCEERLYTVIGREEIPRAHAGRTPQFGLRIIACHGTKFPITVKARQVEAHWKRMGG